MANMCQGPSGFLYALTFMFLIMIMLNRDLGNSISEYVGLVLYPIIGFGSKWPLLTMFGAGLLTISISTTIRHFTMDWIEMAKKQRIMNAYNKELREAQKAGNQSKVERLQEQNSDIMSMQSQSMMAQMKASIFSMVVAILIFRWMYRFIDSVPQPTATTPWNVAWPLVDSAFGELCGSLCMSGAGGNGGFPYWILLYMTITIPIGQALMRGFKFFEYSRRLRAKGENVFANEEKLRNDLDANKKKKKEERRKVLEEAKGATKEKKPKTLEGPPERKKGKKGKK